MKKIGIITHYYESTNYGGLLQSYALAFYINNYTIHNAKQISYKLSEKIEIIEKKTIFQKFSQMTPTKFVRTLLIRLTNCKSVSITKKVKQQFQLEFEQRKKSCEIFEKSIPHTTDKYYTKENIVELNDIFDIFISGSDQVWNPNWYKKPFFLEFVHDTIPKIAYAASMGVSYISDKQKEVLFPIIENFDFISVREPTAKKLLTEIQKEVVAVLDPVFLPSKENWVEICADRIVKEPYMFRHFLQINRNKKKIENILARSKHLIKVSIPYLKAPYNTYEKWSEYAQINSAGPKEFLSLIMHSDCIVTDSFHTVAFSIIFNKNFYVVHRNSDNSKLSINSRLTDILHTFQLTQRMVSSIDQLTPELLNETIDYTIVNKILIEKKEESINFLLKALGDA